MSELERAWGDSEERVYVFGNFFCGGVEIDAAIFKRDAIILIDFKDYGGEIIFSENGPWTADGKLVKGGNKANPFDQIVGYRNALRGFLSRLFPLPSHRKPNLRHMSCVVMFHDRIRFDDNQLPPNVSKWFHVTDFEHAAEHLDEITSAEINLTNFDLIAIAKALDVPVYRRIGTRSDPSSIVVSREFRNAEDYREVRRPYLPSNIRSVIITESPPDTGKYLYDPSGDVDEPLFAEFMRTLIGQEFDTKDEGLAVFAAAGWLSLTGTYEQINHLHGRDEVLHRDYPILKQDLIGYGIEKHIPLILIRENVLRVLEPLLRNDGFSVANKGRIIEYPSYGRGGRFREKIKPILDEYDLCLSV
ncbi:nuclease-related domain-containing protein [Pseudomonadota bacterium]